MLTGFWTYGMYICMSSDILSQNGHSARFITVSFFSGKISQKCILKNENFDANMVGVIRDVYLYLLTGKHGKTGIWFHIEGLNFKLKNRR